MPCHSQYRYIASVYLNCIFMYLKSPRAKHVLYISPILSLLNSYA